MHFPHDVSSDQIENIKTEMKRPEGTVAFKYTSQDLFNSNVGAGILLELVTGSILFRIERDSKLNLYFYHSSPGTGTRVSIIDLNNLEKSSTVTIFLTWSDKEIGLSVGSKEKIIHSKGQSSKKQFRVDTQGQVVQIGDPGIKVMGVSIVKNKKEVLGPTAIETWKETIESIRFLLKGTSSDGYIFEFICTNLAIAILVTGFESYCKRRFLELESEGIKCNFNELIEEFIPKDKREITKVRIQETAKTNQITPTQQLVNEGKINFQNYCNCKTAYRKGYGIKFSKDLGVSNVEIKKLKELIGYRHKVIHISPLRAMPPLDSSQGVGVKPPRNEYANIGVQVINKFVTELHDSTLKLRS